MPVWDGTKYEYIIWLSTDDVPWTDAKDTWICGVKRINVRTHNYFSKQLSNDGGVVKEAKKYSMFSENVCVCVIYSFFIHTHTHIDSVTACFSEPKTLSLPAQVVKPPETNCFLNSSYMNNIWLIILTSITDFNLGLSSQRTSRPFQYS